MKLSIIKLLLGIVILTGLFLTIVPGVSIADDNPDNTAGNTDPAPAVVPTSGAVHGMSPRTGVITSPTGAGVADIKVTEYTDWCPPHFPADGSYAGLDCPVPTNCHVERSVRTDASGRYYFAPLTPPQPPTDSPEACKLNVWWMYTCWNPTVLFKIETDRSVADSNGFQIVPTAQAVDNVCPPVQHPTTNVTDAINTDITCDVPPACNVMCQRDDQCAGAKDGCTSCLGGVCRPPVACNSACTNASDCAYAPNGCTACAPNDAGTGSACRPPAACGVGCVRDDQCAGATKDGCTSCIPNNAGTGSVCSKPPACGVGCERDDQCAGSKDGCTVCAANDAGKKICQTPFDENACKCDGFNALNLQNPTNSNFQFEAFGKVEGANTKTAQIKSIQFQMTKSTKSNPNAGAIIATSDLLTPQIVSNTADKIRYRSTWSVVPPAYDPNGVYRVFANIKCGRKSASSSASLGNVLGDNIYNSDSNRLVEKDLNYSPARLAQTDQNLQLGTLEDGYFTKITETDSCRFIRFEYGQY